MPGRCYLDGRLRAVGYSSYSREAGTTNHTVAHVPSRSLRYDRSGVYRPHSANRRFPRMDEGLLAAVRRFPGRRCVVGALAAHDESFRLLCSDFAEAQGAFSGGEKSTSAVREQRFSEYQDLVEGPGGEIATNLDAAQAGGSFGAIQTAGSHQPSTSGLVAHSGDLPRCGAGCPCRRHGLGPAGALPSRSSRSSSATSPRPPASRAGSRPWTRSICAPVSRASSSSSCSPRART